ncbi:hypothetical protein D3C81_923800 [compost metagenome]
MELPDLGDGVVALQHPKVIDANGGNRVSYRNLTVTQTSSYRRSVATASARADVSKRVIQSIGILALALMHKFKSIEIKNCPFRRFHLKLQIP